VSCFGTKYAFLEDSLREKSSLDSWIEGWGFSAKEVSQTCGEGSLELFPVKVTRRLDRSRIMIEARCAQGEIRK